MGALTLMREVLLMSSMSGCKRNWLQQIACYELWEVTYVCSGCRSVLRTEKDQKK